MSMNVRIRAIRWVSDDPQPGLVECRLVDADGVEHVLIDKCAVFDGENRLRPDASYPIELTFPCRVLGEGDDDLVIELAWHVESEEGETTFRVRRDLIV